MLVYKNKDEYFLDLVDFLIIYLFVSGYYEKGDYSKGGKSEYY